MACVRVYLTPPQKQVYGQGKQEEEEVEETERDALIK